VGSVSPSLTKVSVWMWPLSFSPRTRARVLFKIASCLVRYCTFLIKRFSLADRPLGSRASMPKSLSTACWTAFNASFVRAARSPMSEANCAHARRNRFADAAPAIANCDAGGQRSNVLK